MKRMKYFILFLFVYSVFSSMVILADIKDYDSWYQEHEWLMLKQEKQDWKLLKSDSDKESFMAKFYASRDSDNFTSKNEFQLAYGANLEKARKDYPDFNDPRRYIYLLFGEPNSKHLFAEQTVAISFPPITVRIGDAEVWHYDFGGKRFQAILAKASIFQLQLIKDGQKLEQDQSSFSVCNSRYEIFYIGPEKYSNVAGFLEDFFQENFRLMATSDIIDDLKKPILERADNFYKQPKPEVQKKKYSNEWKGGMQIFIDQFDVGMPQETGIMIWIFFGKDSLSCDAKKNWYSGDISLYCEMRDAGDKRLVYYCDDNISYRVHKPKVYYHFWGSLPPGKYKFILELGDNIGRRYKRIEQNINLFDFSTPGLKAGLLVGKIAEAPEMVKGKPGYFSFKEGEFYLAFAGEYFRDDDEIIVVLDISGFQKNLYGNPCLKIALLFVGGDIRGGKFVPSGEVFNYGFLPIEKNGDRFQGVSRIKIKDLVASLKIPSGCYQIKLQIEDKIANQGGVKDYPYPILILSVGTLKDNLNILNMFLKRTD